MIEILSYGTLLQQGRYTLYSKFHSVVNFSSGSAFVFIVKPEVGPGPLHIVIQGIPMDSLNVLELSDDCCYLNGEKCPFDTATRFNASLEPGNYDPQTFLFNLQTVAHFLRHSAPTESLTFLLDERGNENPKGKFEQAYRLRMMQGWETIRSGSLETGIRLIKGVGPGLTPGGDDFLCGMLIALNVLQAFFQRDSSQMIAQVYELGKSANPFTQAFLHCAAKGQLIGKYKEWIIASVTPDTATVINRTRELLSIGSTSGADTAVGFLLTVQRFLHENS